MLPSVVMDAAGSTKSETEKPFVHPEELSWGDPLLLWLNPLIRLASQRQVQEDDVWPSPSAETVDVQSKKLWAAWSKELEAAEQQKREPSLLRAMLIAYGDRFLLAGIFQFSFMVLQLGQPFLVGELVAFVANGNESISVGIGLALGFAAVSLLCSVSLSQTWFYLRKLGVAVRSAVMMAVYEQALRLTTAARMKNTVGQTTNLMAIDAEKLNLAIQFVHFLWHGPVAGMAIAGILIYELGYAPALVGVGYLIVLLTLQNHLAESIGVLRRGMVKHTDERVKLTNELLQAIRVIKLYAWEKPIEARVIEVRHIEVATLRRYLDTAARLRELLFSAQPVLAVVMFTTSAQALNRPLSVVQVFRMLAFLNITRFPLNLLAQGLKNAKDGLVSVERLRTFFLLPTLQNTAGRVHADHPQIILEDATFSWTTPQKDVVSAGTDESEQQLDASTTAAYTRVNSTDDTKGAVKDIEMVEQHPNPSVEGKADDELKKETKVEPKKTEGSGFKLQGLNLRTERPNELIAVIGAVGSGKSSLLSALLGEMITLNAAGEVVEGEARLSSKNESTVDTPTFLHGTTAYCAQTPWIQNLTMRQNICFELPAAKLTSLPGKKGPNRDKKATSTEEFIQGDQASLIQRYEDAVEAAALLPDIQVLPSGDLTEIGEKGINLSGGQKARVALARAFFAAYRAQIYLFDDPFSAVDANTGNVIFRKGVLGLLHDKLRLVALNSHMHLLRHFDRVLVLDEGRLVAEGTYPDLWEAQPSLMAKLTGITADQYLQQQHQHHQQMQVNQSADAFVEDSDGMEDKEHMQLIAPSAASPLAGTTLARTNTAMNCKNSQTAPKKLVVDERIDSPLSAFMVYLKYFSAALSSTSDILDQPFYQQHSNNQTHAQRNEQKDQQDSRTSSHTFTTFQLIQGFLVLVCLLIIFATAQLFRIAVDYYLALYASHYDRDRAMRDPGHRYWENMYYGSFGFLLFSLLLRAVYVNYFATQSSRYLHASLMRRVLSAPIPSFFDTHTVGAILNRFSKDVETVDVNIPEFLLQLLINWAQVFAIFALCIWASPWFVIILIPLAVGFQRVFTYFSAVSKGLKRLENVTRSPIYASLSETLIGLETIRAFGDTSRFLQQHLLRMDRNQKLFYHLWMCISWMTVRLELATSVILLAVALLAVVLGTQTGSAISAVSLGLALSYGLQLTALFQRCVQLSIEMSTYMTSTERVLEYLEDIEVERETYRVPNVLVLADGSSISTDGVITKAGSLVDTNGKNNNCKGYSRAPDSEETVEEEEVKVVVQSIVEHADTDFHDDTRVSLDASWPRTGRITFDNVWMAYRDNAPVLQGLTLTIQPGERVGICGRTGAGKSSLLLALFRIVEISLGRITLDGVDVSQVPLTRLRSSLAIIPQDPVLFTGTLRFQLDPFAEHSDEDVWRVLQQVNLDGAVQQWPGQLQFQVTENGENLSQGQRQLLCIARALLRDTKVLVVDEGTSAVDPHTDQLIQQVLRNLASQRGTTVLAIAHRLQTIVDFDKILVLGQGKVLEYDTPQRLLAVADVDGDDRDASGERRTPPLSVFAEMLRDNHLE